MVIIPLLLLLLIQEPGLSHSVNDPGSWSVRDIVRTIEPSVVWIVASLKNGEFNQGSGVVVRSDGYILTNAHVIDGACKIYVGWTERFSRSILTAEVAASDSVRDLALLHVKATHLPVPPFHTGIKPRVGDAVIALGYPAGGELGLGDLSVTRGLLSSIRKDTSGAKIYQTDAAITLGCSGGPLYDLDTGSVIGIIQGKGVSLLEGFNFAIPIERFIEFAGTSYENGIEAAVGTFEIKPDDKSSPEERALKIYNLAMQAREEKSWAEALSNFLVANRLENNDPQAAFRAAESYAALDQTDQALKWLKRAFELGYSEFDSVLDEPGFESVRKDKRFIDLVRSF